MATKNQKIVIDPIFQEERTVTRHIANTEITLHYRYKYFETYLNGLPVTSHLEIRYRSVITNKEGSKSHFFPPALLADFNIFDEFIDYALDCFIKDGSVEIDRNSQLALF